ARIPGPASGAPPGRPELAALSTSAAHLLAELIERCRPALLRAARGVGDERVRLENAHGRPPVGLGERHGRMDAVVIRNLRSEDEAFRGGDLLELALHQ